MDLNYIEAFVSLVTHKSFTRAADALFISQSTLSYRIDHLEKELGVQLITRSRGKKTFALTQAGMEFIPLAERWLMLERDTHHFKSDTRQRTLSVSCVETISLLFSELYADVSRENPFMLSLHSAQSFSTIDAVETHSVDIGFTVRERASRNAQIVPLFSEKHYLLGCLNSDKRVIDPRTLAPERELLTDWGTSYRAWHAAYFASGHRPLAEVETVCNVSNYFDDGIWCIVPACALPFLKMNIAALGHDAQVYEMTDPPPNRVCYKVVNCAPHPSRTENIRCFEAHLERFLKEHELHL